MCIPSSLGRASLLVAHRALASSPCLAFCQDGSYECLQNLGVRLCSLPGRHFSFVLGKSDAGAQRESRLSHTTVAMWLPMPHHSRAFVRLCVCASGAALGAGYARNRCLEVCHGEWLCLQDADDVSLPERVELQLAAAMAHPGAIVGSCFRRAPEDATPRYTAWCNSSTPEQLVHERFRESTLAQPTW